MISRLDGCDDDRVQCEGEDGRIDHNEEKFETYIERCTKPPAPKKEAMQAFAMSWTEGRRITSATPPRQPRRHARVACERCRAEGMRTA